MEMNPDLIKLVANDVRASYPEMTDDEAIEHARNTVSIDEIDGYGLLADAYRTVLGSDR